MAETKPREGRCHFWLGGKKKRFCSFEVVSAKASGKVVNYCRFHLPKQVAEANPELESVVCELCKSAIFKSKYKTHLKRCVVYKQQSAIKAQPFYHENLHFFGDYQTVCDSTDAMESTLSGFTLDTMTAETRTDALVSALNALLDDSNSLRVLKSALSFGDSSKLEHCVSSTRDCSHRKSSDSSRTMAQPMTDEKQLDCHLDLEWLLPPMCELSDESIAAVYAAMHTSKGQRRHCAQIESIIANIRANSSLTNAPIDTCFQNASVASSRKLWLELGSGKAQLGSVALQWSQSAAQSSGCGESFLVTVDNAKYRRRDSSKKELKKTESVAEMLCGIQHLNASLLFADSLPTDLSHDCECIVLSKHLCGAATDFALRLVRQMAHDSLHCAPIGCVAIAVCCRGKCSFETFCNHQFIKETLTEAGFKCCYGKLLFEELIRFATWSVDSATRSRERMRAAQLCRALIDSARFRFVSKALAPFGFRNCKLLRYCNEEITRENVLLLASKLPLGSAQVSQRRWHEMTSF